MLLRPSASSMPMTVWPVRPETTSTPSRSRYSASRYAARRVSVVVGSGSEITWMAVLIIGPYRALEDFRVVELAEQFLLRRPVLGDRPADPVDVHVVLQRDVLVGDVAAPDAAAHARGHRHAVGEGAGVRARLHLADHDAAHRRHERQAVDVIVVVRIDSAGVSLAGGLEDLPHLVERVIETVGLEHGEHRAQLFRGEPVLLADLRLL